MSTPPSDLPPTPSGHAPTQLAGQQSAPSTAVPAAPAGAMYAPAAAAQTNTLAIVSLVTALGSFVAHVIPGIGGFTVALVAVITGYMARQQIKRTGEAGMGMATAGMIIGAVHLGFILIAVFVVLFLLFIMGVALFGVSAHR